MASGCVHSLMLSDLFFVLCRFSAMWHEEPLHERSGFYFHFRSRPLLGYLSTDKKGPSA